jgi:hypothetical protein
MPARLRAPLVASARAADRPAARSTSWLRYPRSTRSSTRDPRPACGLGRHRHNELLVKLGRLAASSLRFAASSQVRSTSSSHRSRASRHAWLVVSITANTRSARNGVLVRIDGAGSRHALLGWMGGPQERLK